MSDKERIAELESALLEAGTPNIDQVDQCWALYFGAAVDTQAKLTPKE